MGLESTRGFIYRNEGRGVGEYCVEVLDWIIIDYTGAMLALYKKLEGQFDIHQHLE